jgi:Tol biopolymer transport system component
MLAISSKGDIAMRLGSEPIGTLARAPIGGGTPREILEHVTTADWAPDGESMAIVRRVGGSFRLEYPVGNVLLANQVRKPDHLRISPDGSTAAIMVYDAEGGDFSLTLFSAGKQPRAIARSFRMVGGLAWTPDGSAVLLGAARTGSAPAIYRIDLSGRMSPAYRMPGWPQLMDTAGNGDLLVAAINSRLGITALTPFHSRLQDLAWLDGSLVADLSADGTMLLFGEISAGDGRHAAIYLRKTDGSPAVRIGFGNRFTLSQDGKFVACLRTGPKGSFAVVLPAGPGEERVLPPDGRRNEAVECHPDGRRLLITSSANGSSQTFLRPIAGGEASAVTQPGVIASKISPDGKFALARAGEKLRLIPLDGGRAQDVVSLKSGEQPCRWAPDGRSVFLAAVDHGGHSVEISRIEMSTGRRERWKQLAPVEPGAVFWGTPALSADGQSYAVSFRQDLGELYLIKNVI